MARPPAFQLIQHINYHKSAAEIRRQTYTHIKPATCSSTVSMHMAKSTIVSVFKVFSAYKSSGPMYRSNLWNRVEEAGVDLGGGGGDHKYIYIYTYIYMYTLFIRLCLYIYMYICVSHVVMYHLSI